MNQISYDKWQAMIRLPYLTVLAFLAGQRMHLYESQVNCILAELAGIQNRNLHSLLGQLAADSAVELTSQLKTFKADDVTHLPLQCARIFTAAREAMTTEQFDQYVADNIRIVGGMQKALPWYGRLRVALQRPLAKDPRAILRSELEAAASPA